jgi:hypothetical protein
MTGHQNSNNSKRFLPPHPRRIRQQSSVVPFPSSHPLTVRGLNADFVLAGDTTSNSSSTLLTREQLIQILEEALALSSTGTGIDDDG